MSSLPASDPASEIVILGAGFAGMQAATALRGAPLSVTVVDRRNFHLFQPLLYQVATGGLSPANIASPIRALLRGQDNARVVLADVRGIDVAGSRVLTDGEPIPYEALVVATGAQPAYFGHPEWEPFAPGLKTLEDATEIRRRIYEAFETAERDPERARREGLLQFVVIGGGPTGVELAGTLAEIARQAMRRDFRRINPASARVILVEGGARVLATQDPALSERAKRDLEKLGVDVRLGARVARIDAQGVTLSSGETLTTRSAFWAAGIEASPLGRMLAEQCGLETDRVGRLRVEKDFTLPGHPEIFVAGDLAIVEQDGAQLPGTAPVAMQQGRWIGRLLRARRAARTVKPFRYVDKGQMATIGRTSAVGTVGGVKLTGFIAWLTWLFVHLLYLVDLENRVLVLIQWAWNYATYGRAARLITRPWKAGETWAKD